MRALVVLALVAGCCKPTRIDRPVLIEPPACRERDHPEPPNAELGSEAWSLWYVQLVGWVLEVEAACPRRERRISATTDDAPWQAGYP